MKNINKQEIVNRLVEGGSNSYQDLVVRFNRNFNKIKRELASKDVANLYAKYNPEDDGHLAKILTLRGINL